MERITSATIFKSFDGKVFMSENECREYERERENYLNRFCFYEVKHSPDLNETGRFTEGLLIAVYSEYGYQFQIANKYCMKRFGYLGPSVMGYGFQECFHIKDIEFEDFNNGIMEVRFNETRKVEQIFLSPKEIDEFKAIERFDYMKEWGFK